ncbi:AI-2E family transporter [Defluviitalea phaphyphila]|uniref:AI-2E family transporter n=1 Tax=Defluviitalea phaphyphila TaxID=1473580 RepID=UPI0007308ECB|nr:AI-2E family transporter [Defluviitalea phaphyphila]
MKKVPWDTNYFKISFYAFLVLAMTVLFEKIIGNIDIISNYISLFFKEVFSILSPFIYGFFIAYILSPAINKVEKWLQILDKRKGYSRLRRILSILIVYVTVFGFLSLTFIYVIPQISQSIIDLFQKLPENLIILENELENFLSNSGYLEYYDFKSIFDNNINSLIQQSSLVFNRIFTYIINSALGITSSLLNLLLGLMIGFYLLNEKEKFIEKLKNFIYALFKVKTADKIIEIAKESHYMFNRFFVGKFIDSFIMGVLCFIGMLFLKNPYALLISVIVGITNMIPYFGPFIGAIPAVLITLFISPIKALWVSLFIFALQQFDGIILGPKILGDSTGLSPFWVIFAIIVGGALFGVLGMLIGVPAFAVFRSLFNKWIEKRLNKKGIN